MMSQIVFTQEVHSEFLWLLYYDVPKDAPVVNNVFVPIILSFVLSAVSFIPLGQLIAARLEAFKARSSALRGYSWDIFGSILGIAAFTCMSFLGLFPVVWFGCFLVIGLIFVVRKKLLCLLYIVSSIVLVVAVAQHERAIAYSPYYALGHKQNSKGDFLVLTNGSLHQRALNIDPEKASSKYSQTVIAGYNYPYNLLRKKPKKVLVIGAGTGNDVAVLLQQGIEQIDAVEIDPTILEWGKKYHPNKPYSSPRVRAFATDARSYLNNTKEKYDLIVFGTLDSMTRLSALSNVRLDNFVYTKECIERAKDHLVEGGGLVMYFMVGAEYIDKRLMTLLAKTFSQVPLVNNNNHFLFNRVYMAGSAYEHRNGEKRKQMLESFLASDYSISSLSTDDWPYLYLSTKGLSSFYQKVMGMILLIAFLGISLSARVNKISLFKRANIDLELFLFGLAFLLIETRSITSMNLVWGATWLTSAIVFASILSMVLLATLITEFKPMTYKTSMLCLVGMLVLTYLVPTELLVGKPILIKFALSMILVGGPIYFSSICFALLFAKRDSAGLAFGWNILGAVVGGLLEFLSMLTGLKTLLLIALLAYLIAFLISKKKLGSQSL